MTDLGTALRTWRDRLSPSAVGLPDNGRRRSSGLRREELAMLAGVSADYVTRLEQGRAGNPSAQVIQALARALQLDNAERDHLFRLAGLPEPTAGQINAHLTPGVQRLLRRLDEFPVSVHDAAWNIVAWNHAWASADGRSVADHRPGPKPAVAALHHGQPRPGRPRIRRHRTEQSGPADRPRRPPSSSWPRSAISGRRPGAIRKTPACAA